MGGLSPTASACPFEPENSRIVSRPTNHPSTLSTQPPEPTTGKHECRCEPNLRVSTSVAGGASPPTLSTDDQG